MGAQFEATDYAATGSIACRAGILYYENNWGAKPAKLSEDAAVSIALRALDTAAESDTSTGGVDRGGRFIRSLKLYRPKVSPRCRSAKSLPSSRKRSHDREPYRWVEAIANRRSTSKRNSPRAGPIAALGYRDGILFLTLGQTRQKIFEIYDRIAMGAIGHPGYRAARDGGDRTGQHRRFHSSV
jgi:hypothetical protein